jgi:pSer/pThr/pTyr-binding forkhead associated (FHA) protein
VKCAYCGSELAEGALFCGQCGRPVGTDSGISVGETAEIDLDPTRIVPPTPSGDRFVLQFSTGESVTVHGTGLIGRHPVAEPGEYFDHLVTIVDPSKSVSKTHLEFGQSSAAFWVSDRHSGNGTIINEPDSEPKRCDSGKRYRVARGTRVNIGEQFFVVS